MWRSRQLEPSRSLNRAGTRGLAGSGLIGEPSREDITTALDELERGQASGEQ